MFNSRDRSANLWNFYFYYYYYVWILGVPVRGPCDYPRPLSCYKAEKYHHYYYCCYYYFELRRGSRWRSSRKPQVSIKFQSWEIPLLLLLLLHGVIGESNRRSSRTPQVSIETQSWEIPILLLLLLLLLLLWRSSRKPHVSIKSQSWEISFF